MVALFFLSEVEGEVVVEVAVADQGAELQDGFGAVQAPSGSGHFHPVLDQPACRAFDQAAGDRPADGQEGGVVQVVLLVFQVIGAGVSALAFFRAVAVGRGAARIPACTSRALPSRILAAWALKAQAAKILDGKARTAGSGRRASSYGYSPKERESGAERLRRLPVKEAALPGRRLAGVASGLIEGAARWLDQGQDGSDRNGAWTAPKPS